jgi:hypothetical protein
VKMSGPSHSVEHGVAHENANAFEWLHGLSRRRDSSANVEAIYTHHTRIGQFASRMALYALCDSNDIHDNNNNTLHFSTTSTRRRVVSDHKRFTTRHDTWQRSVR